METSHKKRILIIEDDHHIAEGLSLNLSLQGYDVAIEGNGISGIHKWKRWHPDLIVLDIMLPGIDGLSVLQNIRLEDEQLPILILSARTASEDKIKGLSYGVDDYLTKPFDLEEFLLRIERLLTRMDWYHQASRHESVTASVPNLYAFGPNQIDFEHATAIGQTGTISLTEQEVRLLKLFVANKGKPLTRDKLLEIGWGYTRDTTTRTVDNFIVRFRKYFEINPKKPQYFKSLRSIGYVFDPEDQIVETRKTLMEKLTGNRL
jgi:DNA-binding response OmpR family regulator